MAARWSLAFAVAAVLALGLCALLRHAARTARLRDRVAGAPSTHRMIRRLGGGALAIASLAGWAFAPALPTWLPVVALGALGLTIVGIAHDRGRLPRALETGVVLLAVTAAAFALRLPLATTGVHALDLGVSAVWIALITIAVAGLGDTDGLTTGVGAVAAAGLFALAGFASQDVLATIMVATVGATLGFLAYNAPPASLHLGRGGGLFLGFVLGVASVQVRPAIGAPERLVVALVLLGIPVLDAAVVIVGRLRHRKPLAEGRDDHLPHRLRARGVRTPQIVAVLVAMQLALSVIALFVGRGVLHAGLGAAAAAVLLLALLAVCVSRRARVYREKARGLTGRARLVVLALVVVVLGASVPVALAAVDVRDIVDDGRAAAERGLRTARNGDPEAAAQAFAEAVTHFERARDRIDTPFTAPALALPVVGANVHAARELARIGVDLSRAGEALTASVDPDRLHTVNGRVPLDEVRALAPKMVEAARLLHDARRRLEELDTTYLVAPVREAINEVSVELAKTETDATRGAIAARLVPAILGADGPRRYFLAVQNPAELRATGGFIGSWGILTAVDGEIDLSDFQRTSVLNQAARASGATLEAPADYTARYAQFEPQITWQNVNMSPDLTTVGQVIASLYEQSFGEQIDGVLAVDPVGLAALLELTGPVNVPGWPVPITTENVVDVTLRDAYSAFADTPERADFLGDVAREVIDVATNIDLGAPATIGKALGRASHEGHLSLYFTRPDEQHMAEVLDAAGEVPPARDDSLLFVTQNAGANKLDYYLHRTLDYTVRLEPHEDGRVVDARAAFQARLENTGPASGLPQIVIGPYEGAVDRFVAGENHAFVSVYSPLGIEQASVNDEARPLQTNRELGRNVGSTFLSTFAESTTTLDVDLAGQLELAPGGWYRLHLGRQPTLNPDEVTVTIVVADGWRIAATRGLRRVSNTRATGRLTLDEEQEVSIRLEPAAGGGVWDRLQRGG